MQRRAMLLGGLISPLIAAQAAAAVPVEELKRIQTRESSDLDYYSAFDGRNIIEVRVDGQVVDDITECHTREGWATQYVRHANGKLVIRKDEVITRTLWGKVEVYEALADGDF